MAAAVSADATPHVTVGSQSGVTGAAAAPATDEAVVVPVALGTQASNAPVSQGAATSSVPAVHETIAGAVGQGVPTDDVDVPTPDAETSVRGTAAPVAADARATEATDAQAGDGNRRGEQAFAARAGGDASGAPVAGEARRFEVPIESRHAQPVTPAHAAAQAQPTVAEVSGEAVATAQPAASSAATPASQVTGAGQAAATAPTAPVTAPAAAPQASNAPVMPVHQQIVHGISPMLRGSDGTYQLMLQLAPAQLGNVRVQVQLKNGEVSIQVRAADGSTRDLLRDNIGDLRGSLEEMGLQAGDVDVDSQGPGDTSAFASLLGDDAGNDSAPRAAVGGGASVADDGDSDPTAAPTGDSGLDIRL